jgi:TolB protein
MKRPPHSLAAFAAVACLAWGTATAQSTTTGTPLQALGLDDPAGLIAFVTPGGAPALVDPVGGARSILPQVPGRSQFPAWAPNGALVSFIAFGPGGGGAGLDVHDPATGTSLRVFERPQESPIYHGWSPDGERIALLTSRIGGLGLHLVDPSLGAAEAGDAEPFAVGAPFYWDWAPDGASLLVHRNVLGPGAEVGRSGLAGYDLTPTRAPAGAFQSPAVAPSGAWIAYASRDGADTRRVVLERVAGSADGEPSLRELPHAGLAALAWHPHRDVLAAQRPLVDAPHAYGPIVTIDARTGDLETLTDDLSLAFWWSPDGGTVAYLAPAPGGGDGPERQVGMQVQAGSARVALRVVDVATGLRRELGRFTPSPLFLGQYLPFFDQYARSHRLWSPASDALVLPVLDGGVSVLTVFGLDGAVRTLGSGDMPAWNVR